MIRRYRDVFFSGTSSDTSLYALTVFNVGSLLRQTRGSMMEVFSEDYIRTARAKGLVEFRG